MPSLSFWVKNGSGSRKTLNVATLTYGVADDAVDWDDSGQRWVQRGPYSGRPWCGSSLRFDDDPSRTEVSFWMPLGWWDRPNLHDLREAAHKVALRRLIDVQAEGIDGLSLIGERTREAEVMGVHGSAQTELAAGDRLLAELDRRPVRV